MWVERYLQGDEWKMRGGEEEQVVLICLNNISKSLNLVPFSRGWNTSCQVCIEKNATDTYIQYVCHLHS